MKKDELSEAIKEGINNSTPSRILYLFVGILIIYSFLNAGTIIYNYTFYDATSNVASPTCGESGLEHITCKIKIGNETEDWDTGHFSVCGYQEANAFYEYIKPQIQENNFKNHPSWKIKYLDCN